MTLTSFVLNKRKMLSKKYFKILLIVFAGSIFCLDSYSQNGDSLKIDYNYINSVPQNASVYLNDNLAGETPFRFTKESADTLNSVTITLKLKGYIDYTFSLNKSDMPVNKTINLVPSNKLSVKNEKNTEENTVDYFKTPRKIVPIVVTSVISAGSGALSYYFKKLANDNYDQYLATGNRDKFDKTKKYDLYSGIFLAAFQVGFAVLIYFLLID